MLLNLTVNNLAVIKQTKIVFHPRLTMITGQTGSGKSLIVVAIGLLLGNKSAGDMIRTDTDTLNIQAQFDISRNPKAKNILQKLGFPSHKICELSRTISRTTRHKLSINNKVALLQQFKQLGRYLVTIYNQHNNTSLLSNQTQQYLFDTYASNQVLLTRLEVLVLEYNNNQKEIATINRNKTQIIQAVELLHYQLDELKNIGLDTAGIQTVLSDYQLNQNAKQRYQVAYQIWRTLENNTNNGIVEQLYNIANELGKLATLDKTLATLSQNLSSLHLEAQAVAQDLQSYIQKIDTNNTQQQQSLEAQVDFINNLARKHQCQPEALTDMTNNIQNQINAITDPGVRIQTLGQLNIKINEQYQQLAGEISQNRQEACQTFAQHITHDMQKLGMPNAVFSVELSQINNNELSVTGLESIVFRVCINTGQAYTNLADTVSGGELSRINLAIASLLNKQTPITLIFDEIDMGIGGSVAQIFGQMLRQLSNGQQVICITHLAQVASQGNTHLLVNKSQEKTAVTSAVQALSNKHKIGELARMLDGVKVTSAAKLVARNLLEQVN